jgi:hypothetical protein
MPELNQNQLTLTRPNEVDIVVKNFTPEKTDVEALSIHGIVLLTEQAQDFIFDTSKFSYWTDKYPKVGDRLVWGTLTFEVMNIGDRCYFFTTSSRLRIRVHTKRVV